MQKDFKKKHTHIDVDGEKILEKIFLNNKPVIFISGHFANFELMSMEITKKKINEETIRLLELQKDSMVKFLMKIPKLYYTKSHFPLEISQRAFDHLWRVCESYEMWCKETNQENLIYLNIIE